MSDFITFQKFSSIELAAELVQLLRDNNIEYEIADNNLSVDLTFGGNNQIEKEIKLQPEDFSKVNQLLEKNAEDNVKDTPKDHYLFGFTEEELLEVVQKADEWSKEDFLIAKNILKSLDKNFTQQQLDELRNQRLQELAKPEKGNVFWIILGYIFSLLGGLIGVFIGWHLMTFKKTLPNGQKVYTYTKQAQLHGKIIFLLGVVCMAFWILFRIFK